MAERKSDSVPRKGERVGSSPAFRSKDCLMKEERRKKKEERSRKDEDVITHGVITDVHLLGRRACDVADVASSEGVAGV